MNNLHPIFQSIIDGTFRIPQKAHKVVSNEEYYELHESRDELKELNNDYERVSA